MLLAGYTWTAGGSELAYGLSTIMVAFAFMIAWRWVK